MLLSFYSVLVNLGLIVPKKTNCSIHAIKTQSGLPTKKGANPKYEFSSGAHMNDCCTGQA